ncbi:MAG: SRPBCC family protein [Pseudomonadota bacterium]
MAIDTAPLNFAKFNAVSINRSQTFELALRPDTAFPLFTVHGEKQWIPTWQPTVLHGDGVTPGSVWVTEHNDQTTVWYVASFDTTARTARYVRTTPNVDTGTVDIAVLPSATSGSAVTVCYRLTGLSPQGNQRLRREFTTRRYAAMLASWQQMIADKVVNSADQ